MMFRVLGPIEIKIGGRWLSPGPPKQRAVLAALVLNSGRIVSTESLTEVLWAQEPPCSAAKNIQMYVWRLRKLLGDRLQSRQPGYCLAVEPGELDADVFEAAIDQARQARSAGDLAAASDQFGTALGLWQGAALADLVTADMATDLARPLEEQRVRAIHDLVDVDLDLGRHEELLPRLAAWVAEYPLDEALRARQMRALLNTGRPAQALAAYHAAELVLAAGLGTRPGSGLDALAETARGAPTLPGTARLRDSIRQLPPANPTFIGRRNELTRLCDLLAPRVLSVPVVGVAGPGGIGKSALAIRVGHHMADSFTDGQLYLDLQGASPGLEPVPVGEALRRLLQTLGVDSAQVPPDVADAARLYRSRIAGYRLLVILDNAAGASQVRPLVPGSAGCAVLITARRAMTELDGMTQLYLETLPPGDAIGLFTQVVGAGRIAGEPGEDLVRTVEACAGLPLALRLAGARLVSRPSWSLRALNQRLCDERRRLGELQVGDLAVRTSFAISYESLSASERLVFRCCGLFPGPDFGCDAIAVVVGRDRDEVEPLLEALVDAALLQSSRPGRYRLHDLIRIFAAELADQEDDGGPFRGQAYERLAEWYLRAADVADRLLLPARGRLTIEAHGPDVPTVSLHDQTQAMAWFEAERSNLRAVIHGAAQHGLHRIAWQLPLVMKGFLELRHCIDDWIAVFRVGLTSARTLQDRGGESRALNGLGSGFWRQERYAEAAECFHQALQIVRADGELHNIAVVLNNLGSVLGDAGDFDAAIVHLHEVLDIHRQIGNQLDESFALHNLGHVLHEAQRYDDALPLLERALQLRREQGNRHGEGVTLHCLADTLLGLGRHGEATDAVRRALAIFDQEGNRYGQAAAVHTLGQVCSAQHRPDEAIAHLRRAVTGYHDLGNRRDEARARADLESISDSTVGHRQTTAQRSGNL